MAPGVSFWENQSPLVRTEYLSLTKGPHHYCLGDRARKLRQPKSCTSDFWEEEAKARSFHFLLRVFAYPCLPQQSPTLQTNCIEPSSDSGYLGGQSIAVAWLENGVCHLHPAILRNTDLQSGLMVSLLIASVFEIEVPHRDFRVGWGIPLSLTCTPPLHCQFCLHFPAFQEKVKIRKQQPDFHLFVPGHSLAAWQV